MKRFIICITIMALSSVAAYSQNIQLYEAIVRQLSSAEYQGRGYALDGVRKAGEYIGDEFKKAGADEVTMQPFCIDINTFPGAMAMSIDGTEIKTGKDFVLREYSPGIKGTFNLYFIDTLNYDSEKLFRELEEPANKNALVVCDFWFTYKHKKDFSRLQKNGECSNAGLILTWETQLKFYKAYGEKVADKPTIWVTSDIIKEAKSVDVNIENKFYEGYESDNVIAKIEGLRHDSCYVFTAHYDHLGNLGAGVFYPGANDNASGVAGIITIAQHFAQNKPEFDCWFLAFSGEDANLRGSTHFVKNPLFPLSGIKYLFNLDMIGDNNPVQYCEVSPEGESGFAEMQMINAREALFDELHQGKLAANSDHYPFAEQGVPCILFENENGDNFINYHTTEDTFENMEFSTYPKIFKLIVSFIGVTSQNCGKQTGGRHEGQCANTPNCEFHF